MNGGTGNGFQFRTRRPEDAKAFVSEWQRRHRRTAGRREAIVTVALLVLVLAVWFGWGAVG